MITNYEIIKNKIYNLTGTSKQNNIYYMKYYIILKNGETFNTKWFDEDNLWSEKVHCVIDFDEHKYMIDGKKWIDIKDDNL